MVDFYEYDDDIFHLSEVVPIGLEIGRKYIISDYLYGKCHLFAWALKEYYGSKVKIFTLMEYDNEVERDCLAHCYIQKDGKFFDARGQIDELIIESYKETGSDSWLVEISLDTLKENSIEEMWGKTDPLEMYLLTDHIKTHNSFYN